jgi:hypothetical protein
MRRFTLAAVAALMLALPCVAFGDHLAPGTGSLVVQNGRGIVSVDAKGGIIGRFDSGRITIDWAGGKQPIISGAVKNLRPLGAHKQMYSGTDVHFYYGGSYEVQIVALGINLSAVGSGTATVGPTDYSDPGSYRVNGGPQQPFPNFPVKITLGSG